jgi:hypothetical protein
MLLKVFLAVFLFLHGAMHISYLSPRPPATPGSPSWPFVLERSWVLTPVGLSPDLTRSLGLVLVIVIVAAFSVAAAGVLGIVPGDLWPASIAAGSIASLALLVLFFHPWLVLGVAIDVALMAVALFAHWSPDRIG